MNNRFKFGVAALAAALVAMPASAQDATDASGYDRAAHFDGLYISGFAGLGSQPNDNGDSLVFDVGGTGTFNGTVRNAAGANAFSPGFCNGRALAPTPGAGCARDKDRIEYGGRVGFDRRMGDNLVIGGLLEVSGNDILDGTSGFSTTPASYTVTRGLDYAISARARAGFTPGGGALFYVTGGGSYARIGHDFQTSNTANRFTQVNDDDMVWGYQLGGGAEVMVTDSISVGLEYLFNRYNDDKYYVEVTQGTAPANNPFILTGGRTHLQPSSENFTFHSLRGTVSFHF